MGGVLMRNSAEHTILWWMLFLATLASGLIVGAMQGEGSTKTLDIDSAIDDLTYGTGDPMIAVVPSGRWYAGYIGQGDLNVSWSDNNGSSWSSVSLVSDGSYNSHPIKN